MITKDCQYLLELSLECKCTRLKLSANDKKLEHSLATMLLAEYVQRQPHGPFRSDLASQCFSELQKVCCMQMSNAIFELPEPYVAYILFMLCMQALRVFQRNPNTFCITFAQLVKACFDVDIDVFVRVSSDRRSWPSVLLLVLLSDLRGVRAAIHVLPSCADTNLMTSIGAVWIEDHHVWLLPSKFHTPENSSATAVPVDVYALHFGFLVSPLSVKV